MNIGINFTYMYMYIQYIENIYSTFIALYVSVTKLHVLYVHAHAYAHVCVYIDSKIICIKNGSAINSDRGLAGVEVHIIYHLANVLFMQSLTIA